MSLIKKLAGETAIYGISHILPRILYFILLTPYLTSRLKDTTEYGIYSELYSYSTLILTLLIFRLDTAIFRYGRKGNIDSAIGTAMIPILALIALVLTVNWALGDQIAGALGYADATHYVHWFVYILCLDAVAAVIYAKLRLQTKPYRFLFYRISNVVLTIIIVLLLFDGLPSIAPDLLERLRNGLGIVRKVDYVFIANLIASAFTLVLMLGEFLSLKLKYDGILLRQMISYAAPLVLVGIAGNINQTFSTPIQKLLLGSDTMSNLANAGVYAAAAKLAILLNLVTTAFNYAAEPFFFNNENRKDATSAYGKIAQMYTLAACLLSLGIIAYLDIIIKILGPSYRSGAAIVPILLFAYVLLGIYYNVSIWYKLKDKTTVGAMISFLGMIVTLIVSIIFLPKIGTIASAYAALACYAVMVVVCYFIGQRNFPVQYPVHKIISYIVGTAMLAYFIIDSKSFLSMTTYYIAVTILLAGILLMVWVREVKPVLKT